MRKKWPDVPWSDERWSYTTLDLWRCPYRAHRLKDDKLQEPKGEALHDGRILHDAIGAYIEHCTEANLGSDPGAMDGIARGVFFDPSPKEPHGLPLGAWDEIRDLALNFSERLTVDSSKVLLVEEPVALQIGAHAWWLGVIDFAEAEGTQAWITDWKSDHNLPSRSEGEDSFQLRVYAWMLAKQFAHLKTFHCQLRYVRYGLTPRGVDFTRGEALATEDEILGRIEMVRNLRANPPKKGYPAVAGHYCQWCGLAAECPTRKKMGSAAPPLVQDDTQAIEVAAELTAINRRAAQLKDALREYTAANGSIALDGLEYGHFLTESQTVDDVAELARRLAAAGRDPFKDGLLSPVAAKLEALAVTDEGREILDGLLVDRSHTSFRSRKTKPADRRKVAAS